jgi:hypothetical protein
MADIQPRQSHFGRSSQMAGLNKKFSNPLSAIGLAIVTFSAQRPRLGLMSAEKHCFYSPRGTPPAKPLLDDTSQI